MITILIESSALRIASESTKSHLRRKSNWGRLFKANQSWSILCMNRLSTITYSINKKVAAWWSRIHQLKEIKMKESQSRKTNIWSEMVKNYWEWLQQKSTFLKDLHKKEVLLRRKTLTTTVRQFKSVHKRYKLLIITHKKRQ